MRSLWGAFPVELQRIAAGFGHGCFIPVPTGQAPALSMHAVRSEYPPNSSPPEGVAIEFRLPELATLPIVRDRHILTSVEPGARREFFAARRRACRKRSRMKRFLRPEQLPRAASRTFLPHVRRALPGSASPSKHSNPDPPVRVPRASRSRALRQAPRRSATSELPPGLSPHGRNRRTTRGLAIGDQNSALPGARGKGITSRMLPIPVTNCTARSKPSPKPECGTVP